MRARGRVVAVLAHLLGGALVLSASVVTWATVRPVDVAAVVLDGTAVAPALAPVALTLAALGLALSLASPIVARVLAVVGAAVVAIGATHLVQRVASIDEAIVDAASTATGITTLDAPAATTAAPALAAVGLALALAAALWAFVTAPSWRRRQAQQRFERAESGLAWDALDDGEDPTDRDAADDDAADDDPSQDERGTRDR